MTPYVDILCTRGGYKPTLVLVVPVASWAEKDAAVRCRCTIPDDEYQKKMVSPLGGVVDPSLGEVFIPVEQRFESALLDFDELKRKYPLYADLIHHELRLSPISCPNGWYDLLLPIAHDYAVRKTKTQRAAEQLVDIWHEWWRDHKREIPCAGLLPVIDSMMKALDGSAKLFV